MGTRISNKIIQVLAEQVRKNIYQWKQNWKLFLLIMAIIIGLASLYYTQQLVSELADEEKRKVQLWASATAQLGSMDTFEGKDFNFLILIIQGNKTVPVILTNEKDDIIAWRNIDSVLANNNNYLHWRLSLMKEQHEPIEIYIAEGLKHFIYYEDSTILKKLKYFPFIQITVIMLFLWAAYSAFSTSRRAEQDKVWVGLSKETAHQLGTPTSSLMAWIEIMKMKDFDSKIVNELEKDVNRLEKIADRFSKIGSIPKLKSASIVEVLQNSVSYLEHRFSGRIRMQLNLPDKDILVLLNVPLFEWVIENTCRNAYDAMGGEGIISIYCRQHKYKVYIDICDTGKGIPKSKQKTIFKPGFTTKKTGWGLGLSLSKRIIEEYHHGKIFVLNSELGKGTTLRISLNTLLV